jgi:hypothetical protein
MDKRMARATTLDILIANKFFKARAPILEK